MRVAADSGGGAYLSPTPLWPAGHLPLKGGDHLAARLSQISSASDCTYVGKSGETPTQPISPLEGEMSGRTEGGRWQ